LSESVTLDGEALLTAMVVRAAIVQDLLFRDPNDDHRVWVVFDWEEEGYKNLLSDPEMPAIFQEAGLEGRPETAELAREHDA
jgi:hypothetical protein